MITSPPPASAAADTDFYAALRSFPYDQWIPATTAAARVESAGLPRDVLQKVIRTGRRRGLLRTRRDPEQLAFYVKRIAEVPHRAAAPPVE
ncbi:hypothetical protein ACFVFT_38695 [Streptomyces tendae]|uniref:hypothetical protein n=1 Tax=Streptomyces tendae TaxID=1932 RepID=UPI00367CF57D